MPNQELVDYVRNSLAQGYSEKAIRKAMLENGYNAREIDELFDFVNGQTEATPKEQPPQEPTQPTEEPRYGEDGLSFLAYFVLLFGVMMVSLSLSLPLFFVLALGNAGFLTAYALTILMALLNGLIICRIVNLLTKRAVPQVIAGVFSPIFSLFLIIFSLYVRKQVLLRSLENLAAKGSSPIVVTVAHSPFMVSFLFYLFSNWCIALKLYRQGSKPFAWYGLGVVIYLVVWLLATSLANGFIAKSILLGG